MIAKAQTERVGELVGSKYRIVRVLAEGGMGVVYEAMHVVIKRRFAVKFLHPDLTDRREILTRFHREAQAAGALESENIAAAIDFGILAEGTPYIVMEYLIGESLGSLLAREGRLPIGRAADLCLQACRGMEAAHASGILHRDLKPDNLFICRRHDGTDLVKVLDFGIAKLQQIESNDAATRTGTILGTPAYMSPEQARGDRTIDHRTDVYGLAAILFELLSGRRPHPGDSHNAILHHIATQPAMPLHSLQPDLPVPLLEAVERALSSDPNQRHASVAAFGRAVLPFARREEWAAGQGSNAASDLDTGSSTPPGRKAASARVSTGDVALDVALDGGLDGSQAVVSVDRPPPRKGQRTVIAVGAALVATVGLVALMASGSSKVAHSRAPAPAPAPAAIDDRTVQRPLRSISPPPSPAAIRPEPESERHATPQVASPVEPQRPAAGAHPAPTRKRIGSPTGHPIRISSGIPIRAGAESSGATPPSATPESRTPLPLFDHQNPYDN